MTDTGIPAPKAPLGVGKIIGDSFGLVMRNLVPFLMVAAIPATIGVVLNLVVYGAAAQNVLMAFTDPLEYAATAQAVGPVAQGIVGLLGIMLWGLAAASMTAAAYQALSGRGVSVGGAISTGMGQILWVILLMILGGIAIYAGFIALILPGLYLMALWSVIIPAAVVEKTGFGSFGRSVRLTKEYRWPIVGLLMLFFLVILLVMIVSVLAQGLAFALGGIGVILGAIFGIVLSAFFYAVTSSFAALLYARLVEIKEGKSVEALADIFS